LLLHTGRRLSLCIGYQRTHRLIHGCIYIYILLDTVLAKDVNKYSLAFARCQPIWRTKFGERDLFLAVAKDCGMSSSLNQSQQHQSVFWLVSQSRRMSAICVGICRWNHLRRYCCPCGIADRTASQQTIYKLVSIVISDCC